MRAAADRVAHMCGFTLVEVMVALGVSLAVVAAALALLAQASVAVQVQPERADVEQRVRVAGDAIERLLLEAGLGRPGAGDDLGAVPVPGVFPYRLGLRSAAPPGTVDPQVVTALTLARAPVDGRLASPLPASAGAGDLVVDSHCPPGDPACGFRPGMDVIVYDATGAWDPYTVESVSGSTISVRHNAPDSPKVYAPGSRIVQGGSRTLMLGTEAGSGIPQLQQYDGAAGLDVPVVNHVPWLRFVYYGESAAPRLLVDEAGIHGPRSTYGPPPPSAGDQPTAYPPGENCVFARDPDGAVTPRLSSLGPAGSLVMLDAASLGDGPWCPDEVSPGRYDADLLRLRRVDVVFRVEAAVDSLRGPAGPFFTRGGTATGPRVVPDREVRLSFAPRGLGAAR